MPRNAVESQRNLFGKFGVREIRVKKVKVKKAHPAPWDGICCEACWNATEEKCVCSCGGTNHGRGKSGNYEKLGFEDKFPDLAKSLASQQSTESKTQRRFLGREYV